MITIQLWENPIKEENAPKWMSETKGQVRSGDTMRLALVAAIEVLELSTPAIAET